MTQFGRDLLDYIKAHKSGTPFVSCEFSLNYINETKTDIIAVYDTGGYSPDRYHSTCLPIDRPTAQLRVRHQSAVTAWNIANTLYEMLDGLYSVTQNGNTYLQITCTAPPTYLGTDEVSTSGKAHEYTLNLYSMIERI